MKKRFVLAGAVILIILLGGMAYGEGTPGKGKINVNTATIDELQLLPGVGETLAKNIMAFRKAHGPFKAVSELVKVKGIGEKKLKSLQGYVKLDGKSDFEPAQKKPAPEKPVS